MPQKLAFDYTIECGLQDDCQHPHRVPGLHLWHMSTVPGWRMIASLHVFWELSVAAGHSQLPHQSGSVPSGSVQGFQQSALCISMAAAESKRQTGASFVDNANILQRNSSHATLCRVKCPRCGRGMWHVDVARLSAEPLGICLQLRSAVVQTQCGSSAHGADGASSRGGGGRQKGRVNKEEEEENKEWKDYCIGTTDDLYVITVLWWAELPHRHRHLRTCKTAIGICVNTNMTGVFELGKTAKMSSSSFKEDLKNMLQQWQQQPKIRKLTGYGWIFSICFGMHLVASRENGEVTAGSTWQNCNLGKGQCLSTQPLSESHLHQHTSRDGGRPHSGGAPGWGHQTINHRCATSTCVQSGASYPNLQQWTRFAGLESFMCQSFLHGRMHHIIGNCSGSSKDNHICRNSHNGSTW